MANTVTDPICTLETCPWNGKPISEHPIRERDHLPEIIKVNVYDPPKGPVGNAQQMGRRRSTSALER